MKLNQYKWSPLKDLIAEGAFAEVFKARDINNEDRFVALKIYKEGISKGTNNDTVGNKYTLEKEFRKIDGLSHTNIISFYGLDYIKHKDSLGRISNYPVIIMEYASEGTLLHFIQSNKSLDILENLMIQIINGVAYLHDEGTIHRDLKPGNILISKNRRGEPVAKITDFGISRDLIDNQNLEQSITEGVGTPHYMAPEQFFKKKFGINGEISKQTDIWGLGIIIYRMLTGILPFGHKAKDYDLVRDAIIYEVPDISIIPERYKELIKCCLQKNASDRPSNALILLEKIGEPAILEEEETKIVKNTNIVEEELTIDSSRFNKLDIYKEKKNTKTPIISSILVIISLILGALFFFEEGSSSELAVVQLNKKFGYIDKEGNKTISIKYDAAWAFSEGLGLVKYQGKWGFINANGDEIISTKYDKALPFSEGLAPVRTMNKWGFINEEGKVKINEQFDEVRIFNEGMAPVNKNGKWGFINKETKIIIPFSYDSAYPFSEALAVVRLNDKEGFVNKNGKMVIQAKYDSALSFSDGLAAVNINGKWGFIDKTGNMVIKPSYDNTWGFSEGLAPVLLGNKWGFVDKAGNFIISVKYEGATGFSNGLTAVRLNGKEGFINKDDKIVIPFSYEYADSFIEVYKK